MEIENKKNNDSLSLPFYAMNRQYLSRKLPIEKAKKKKERKKIRIRFFCIRTRSFWLSLGVLIVFPNFRLTCSYFVLTLDAPVVGKKVNGLNENGWFKWKIIYFKVGLSPFKKCVFCFIESTSKMMKNAFYFILRARFVLKIFKFLSSLLSKVGKTARLER